MENEYFTKYLERIGAAPTKANIDYVRRHAPLSKENVKAKLKVKGNMTDEVALIAPEPQVDLTALLPQKVPHKAMLVVGMVNNVADVPEAEDTEFSMAWGSNLKTSGVRDVVADRGQEPHFGDITQKFLFPFNLRIEGMRQIRDLAKEKLARQAAEESKRKQRSARRGSEAPGSRGQTGDPQRPPVQEDSEAPQPLQDERSGRLISEEDLEAEMEGEFEVRGPACSIRSSASPASRCRVKAQGNRCCRESFVCLFAAARGLASVPCPVPGADSGIRCLLF